MLLLRYLAISRMFTRVLSECWRPLHLVFGEYYFFIESKIGADSRVMGIALAIEPLQGWSVFFVCTERFIPLVLCGSSPLRLDPGQLCICTYVPCVVLLHNLSFTAYRRRPGQSPCSRKKFSLNQPILLAESIQNRYTSLWLERGIRPKRQR